MKTLRNLLLAAFLITSFGLSAQHWTLSGADIYNNNAGYVGIGNSGAPSNLLHVAKSMTGPQVIVQNLGGAGGAGFTMIDDLNTGSWKFKSAAAGGFKIRDHASGLDVIVIEKNSLANALYINTLGNVGLGTNSPAQRLDIRGDLQVEDNYPFIVLNQTTSGNAGISFKSSGNYNAWIFYDDPDNLLRLSANNAAIADDDLCIHSDGNITIGTVTKATGYKLSINGKVACEEVLVQDLASWPDYVFAEEYNLMDLNQLEESINQNKHLPGLPSAEEVKENGFTLGEMQRLVLEKVEELTLHTIEQGKQIDDLQNRIKELEEENIKLKK